LRDDVMPGAGRSRGGIGVVKAQRVLTDAFITHENERHLDVPWGIFDGKPGQVGKVEIYNVARPSDIKRMPAKFSGLRVAAGDVHVFYGPCGGGFGDPLERPASQVLDDVLDGFCTAEHARATYGVIVDHAAETVDETATNALRERMRAGAASAASAVSLTPVKVVAAAPSRRQAPAPSRLMSRSGLTPLRERPLRPMTGEYAAAAQSAERRDRTLTEIIRGLREAYGEAWSFEVVEHSATAHAVEVIGQLRANGTSVRESAIAGRQNGVSRGEQLQQAANESLRKCVETLMHNQR
jgi:Hydantoinase B/oxoprolinase